MFFQVRRLSLLMLFLSTLGFMPTEYLAAADALDARQTFSACRVALNRLNSYLSENYLAVRDYRNQGEVLPIGLQFIGEIQKALDEYATVKSKVRIDSAFYNLNNFLSENSITADYVNWSCGRI